MHLSQALSEGMLGGEDLELPNHLSVVPQRQLGVDALLDRRQAQLLQPPGLLVEERAPRDVGKRVAPP